MRKLYQHAKSTSKQTYKLSLSVHLFVVYFIVYIMTLSRPRMKGYVTVELENMWKEAVVVQGKVLSRNYPAGSEETR
jgi:hypothetical protein